MKESDEGWLASPAPWLQLLRQDQQGCCSQVTSAVDEQQKNINIFNYATSALLRALTTFPKWHNRGGNAKTEHYAHICTASRYPGHRALCSALAEHLRPLLRFRVVGGYTGQWIPKTADSHFCTNIIWCRTSHAGFFAAEVHFVLKEHLCLNLSSGKVERENGTRIWESLHSDNLC